MGPSRDKLLARHVDEGKRLRRSQLTDAEEAYVKKLERMGLTPLGFRRYSDGSLTFGACPKWRKALGKRRFSTAP